MSKKVTLRSEPLGDLTRIIIDCKHATTSGVCLTGEVNEAEIVGVLIARHREACRCADKLADHAAPLTRRTLWVRP